MLIVMTGLNLLSDDVFWMLLLLTSQKRIKLAVQRTPCAFTLLN